MAYLTHKIINGRKYYYAEECKRINGKPKRVWQKYLGSIDKIIAAASSEKIRPDFAEIFELGCSATYMSIVKEYKIIETIDNFFHKREQGLSLGSYIAIAAINRGIDAVSKNSMWKWFQGTVLLRFFTEANKASLSSQRFWDNMSQIPVDKIQSVWMTIISRIIEQEKINMDCTCYDGTNFYTFIDSFNTRCTIAKRGKNKQGRKNLRQINYALFCSRKDHFPLYFDVYEGNTNDAKEFPDIIEKFFLNFKKYKPAMTGMTIVFDKGNNSKDNFGKFINDSDFHFVGSVKLGEHKELAVVSNSDKRFKSLSDFGLEDVKAFRIKKTIYNKEVTTIVTFNDSLYTAQVKSISNEINKCLMNLSTLSSKLQDRITGKISKGRKPTIVSVKKQIQSILTGQHMKKLIKVTITEEKGIPSINYSINSKEYTELMDTYLGKSIIITDNHDWETAEIIKTYRSQYIIENNFKQMKDRKTGSWWPMHHWTDQKIQVHGLYCSLTLLIRALIMKKVKENKIKISMNELHEKLKGIKEVVNVYESKIAKKQSNQSVISKLDGTQKKVFELFKMQDLMQN